MTRLGKLLLVLILCLSPGVARAGITFHLFTEEPHIVPEGDVELEQWLWGAGHVPAQPQRPVILWLRWGPVLGLSPHWELSFPVELAGTPQLFLLQSAQVVARYRFFERQDDAGLQPLVSAAYVQPVSFGPPRLALTGVLSYLMPHQLELDANLGAQFAMPFLQGSAAPVSVLGYAAVGFSAQVSTHVHLGVEGHGEVPLNSPTPAPGKLYAGPSLTWIRGPFWLTVGSLFGLTDDSSRILPMVLWAVTL